MKSGKKYKNIRQLQQLIKKLTVNQCFYSVLKLAIFILTFLKIFDIINIENKKGGRKLFVNVKFKNRNMEFTGKTYSYELAADEEAPKDGEIVRLMDENYNYICNGTRVKVENTSKIPVGKVAEYLRIRYVKASLDE